MGEASDYQKERAQKQLYVEQYDTSHCNPILACDIMELTPARIVKWYLFDSWFRGLMKGVIASKAAKINTAAISSALVGKTSPKSNEAIGIIQSSMMLLMKMQQYESINLDKQYQKKKPLKAYIMLRYPVARYIENTRNKNDIFTLCRAMSPELTNGEFKEGTTPRTWWQDYTVDIVKLQEELGWDVRKVHKILTECQRHYYITPLGTVNPYIKEMIEYDA